MCDRFGELRWREHLERIRAYNAEALFSAEIAGLKKAAAMPRYHIDQLPDGWAVIDRATGKPVELDGDAQRGMLIEDASDIADEMNAAEDCATATQQKAPPAATEMT